MTDNYAGKLSVIIQEFSVCGRIYIDWDFSTCMAITQHADPSWELIAKSLVDSGFGTQGNARDREEVYERVFAYYGHLQNIFPQNITWDGDEFEYTEWD